jgi:hypothetical protein
MRGRVRGLAGLYERAARLTGISTCLEGGHELWWVLAARDSAAVVALLPRFVAERSSVVRVREVSIP